MSNELTFSRKLNVDVEAVYRACTNAMMLRRWLADGVTFNVTNGGSFLLWWRQGGFVAGKVVNLKENEAIELHWQGDEDPAATQVHLRIRDIGNGTELTIKHIGFGEDDTWEKSRERTATGWQLALDNLEYMFTHGFDKRIMDRPMVGIFPSLLTPENAQRLGIPVTQGILIGGVVDNTGASAAGLQKDDAIIRIGEQPVTNFQEFGAAVGVCEIDQTVEFEFYRANERHVTKLTFGARPVPEIPTTPALLASKAQEVYDELIGELGELVEGQSETVLATEPNSGEWTARQNIAHLIWTERYVQMTIWGADQGDDNFPWPGNGIIHVAGIDGAYKTIEELLGAYSSCKAETVAMLNALAEPTPVTQLTYNNIAQTVLGFPGHDRQHFQQIRETLEVLEGTALETVS